MKRNKKTNVKNRNIPHEEETHYWFVRFTGSAGLTGF